MVRNIFPRKYHLTQTLMAYVTYLSVKLPVRNTGSADIWLSSAELTKYTMWVKKKRDTILLSMIASPNIDQFSNFQNPFTLRLSKKFAIKTSLNIPPHLKCVATLPCEILKLWKNYENRSIIWRSYVLEYNDCLVFDSRCRTHKISSWNMKLYLNN